MTSVFLIQSPLQCLSAIAAAKRLDGEKNIAIIRFQGEGQKTNQQLSEMVDRHPWAEVIVCPSNAGRGLHGHISLWLFLHKLKRQKWSTPEQLYIGDFRARWMHFIRCILQPSSTYLLDDGAVVISVQRQYFSNNIYWPTKKKSKATQFLTLLPYRRFYDSKTVSTPIHLFTTFAIEPANGQRIEHYSIENETTEPNTARGRLEHTAFHFGSKYSEAGVIPLASELDFTLKIKHFYADQGFQMIYIPHRSDAPSKLDKIRGFGIEVRDLDMPAELYFNRHSNWPEIISAAYSTVLNNVDPNGKYCRKIAFEIPGEMIAKRYREDIEGVYNHYRKIGIEVVPVAQPSLLLRSDNPTKLS